MKKRSVQLILGLPLIFLGLMGWLLVVWVPVPTTNWLAEDAELFAFAFRAGFFESLLTWSVLTGTVGSILLILGGLAMWRVNAGLNWVRRGYVFFYTWSLFHFWLVLDWTGLTYGKDIAVDGTVHDAVSLFFWRYDLLCWFGLALVGVIALHVFSWRRRVLESYGIEVEEAQWGDEFVEDVRVGGKDPQYRKSIYSSVFGHFAVIVLIPWLMGLFGCVDPYRVPKGSGDPVVALVQMVKPKKKKKKKLALRPNSAIYFDIPDLEESEILKEVLVETEHKYKVDPNARAGKMGKGGGKKGGWPDGMDKGVVRFIRLEFGGSDWSDGMEASERADLNFLDEFHELTGFKVAKKPESHPVRYLSKYPPGYAPPFVYMTGDNRINLSQSDIRILRKYLLKGGMLFVDCGSRRFHGSFQRMAKQIFPNEPLRVIADDDPIFQLPYEFANGAPPLWGHGGKSALGVKHKGRWCIFYHPGDINDAWKTGHSGLDPELARGAFQMGTNIVYYAFTNYLEETKHLRK